MAGRMRNSHFIESRALDLPHGRLSWLEAGTGTPVVFLHGIGSAARSFRAQLSWFANGARAMAWNAPGYDGSSGLRDESPGVSDYAKVLAAWLDALAIHDCHLVGHSLGSLIAARFAAEFPNRARTLTLASCAIGHARLDGSERARLLAGRLEDIAILGARGMAEKRGPRLLGPAASPDAVRAVVDVMASVDPQGYSQAARMLSSGDMLTDVARIPDAVPVQVLFGDADAITPPDVNLRVARARANIAVSSIEGAGHALYVESPEAFNSRLAQFIERRR